MRFVLVACAFVVCAYAQVPPAPVQPRLGDAPYFPIEQKPPSRIPSVNQQIGGSSWFDTSTRATVVAAYNTLLGYSGVPMQWTGTIGSCTAGTTSPTYQAAALNQANWFRAIAGVPPTVTLNSTYSASDQNAALIMSANNSLSHTPPSNWTCYNSDGANAASHSNICLGFDANADPGCVQLYMNDTGSNNAEVGHRRWILYPQWQNMGTGDVAASSGHMTGNALWVIDGNYGAPRPATRDTFVAWPPKGYVPYQLAYARWSFSYPGADFSAATVTMMNGSTSISASIDPVQNGYGENTIVFEPTLSVQQGMQDMPIDVTINNVRGTGIPRSFSYRVTLIDPSVSAPGGLSGPTLTSPANNAWVNGGSVQLTWTAVSGATSYDVYTGSSPNVTLVANVTTPSYTAQSPYASAVYWRITAKNATSSANSNVFTFNTYVQVPTITSPSNGATLNDTNATLTWTAASGATSYDLYFGTSSTPPLLTNLTTTSYVPASLTPHTTYYWSVRANGTNGSSYTVGPNSFTTGSSSVFLIGPPEPVTPTNYSTISGTTTQLTWSIGQNATTYDVYLGTSSTPSLVDNVAGTTYSASGLTAGATYYWKIVGRNGSSTASSTVALFYVPVGAFTQVSPFVGATLSGTSTSLTWGASAGATSYDVYFGTSSNPPLVTNTTSTSYTPAALSPNTTYYWKIVSKGANTTTYATSIQSFTSGGTSSPAAPTPLAPANNATVSAGTTLLTWTAVSGATSYDVYVGQCNALTLTTNVSVTSYTTASLPAGSTYCWKIAAKTASGDVFSSVSTFQTAAATTSGLTFIAIPPCRVADSRAGEGKTGAFGPPSLGGGQSRDLPIPASSCNIPSNAKAYSLNVTAVPQGPLGYITLWPQGTNQPFVSTLNAPTGQITANAAIVPAGSTGSISIYAANTTDFVIDINGYFTTTSGGSYFFAATPCRVVDTRNSPGNFGGPSITASAPRDFSVPASPCGIPSTATAYSLNATAVPPTSLGYLSLWPTGQAFPNVSTLNSLDGRIVANAAIVPAGTNGSIRAGASQTTDVVLDTNGYFGPQASNGLTFHSIQPCRAVDTRGETGQTGAFGPPSMTAGQTRSFPLPSSPCGLPAIAGAYSVNVTVVPHGALPYLTIWPTGQSQPYVSTLNALSGGIVANAAIVPAGTNGAVSVFVNGPSDVIIDVNGYFAP